MGRPSTPGPRDGGGEGVDGEGKSGSALWMVLIGIFCVVLGTIAVASPYWGSFTPPGTYQLGYEGSGHFGPFKSCQYINPNGYGSVCSNTSFQPEVYLKIAGVCAIVSAVALAAFTAFSGLYCAMKLNNKHLCLKYTQSTFLSLITSIIAELATVLAVGIGAAQFSLSGQQHKVEIGYCYVLEIVLIIVNLILVIMAFMAHKKAKTAQFPRRAALYEISANSYGPGGGQPHPNGGRNGGIAVTQISGNPYYAGQQNQGYTPATLTAANLPQYPTPGMGVGVGQPYLNGGGGQAQPAGGYNNGYNGHPFVGGQQQQPPTGQMAQPQTGRGVNMSPGVNLNPGGRGVSYHPLAGPGPRGSMDSLNSTQSSVMSFGSTGSFSSNTSITNPMRSSLKKPKNKETNSIASGASKKSVTIAIGQEQTAV